MSEKNCCEKSGCVHRATGLEQTLDELDWERESSGKMRDIFGTLRDRDRPPDF